MEHSEAPGAFSVGNQAAQVGVVYISPPLKAVYRSDQFRGIIEMCYVVEYSRSPSVCPASRNQGRLRGYSIMQLLGGGVAYVSPPFFGHMVKKPHDFRGILCEVADKRM